MAFKAKANPRLVALILSAFALAGVDAAAADDPTPEVRFSVVGEHAELTDDITSVTDTSAHLRGEINPANELSEVTWEFQYITERLFKEEQAHGEEEKWTAVAGGNGSFAGGGEEWHVVETDLTGLEPATAYYVRLVATNEGGAKVKIRPGAPENGRFVTTGPPQASTFAVHAVKGEEMRGLGDLNPHGISTRYHFEYVAAEQFAKDGFAESQSTAPVEVPAAPEIAAHGNGSTSRIVGQDIPALVAGETYHYRFVATNADGTSLGANQTLTVPSPAAAETSSCSNDIFRTGPSGRLVDCRAYEQVTPSEKRGAMDVFRYGLIFEGVQVGEDGEHVSLRAPGVQWGAGADSAEPTYFFTRTPGNWQMVSATPQPEAGIDRYTPMVFSSNLTNIGVGVSWLTSPATPKATQSENVEFKAGPPGGPYTTVASIPRTQLSPTDGWVAASSDASRLILKTEDHKLLARATGTTSGSDLYEYAEGRLSQVNVKADGSPISPCGAVMASGDPHEHPMSLDGSRTFFIDNCTEHLYMRVGDARTVDIGPYKFRSANTAGTLLLLERETGGKNELLLYDTTSEAASLLVSAEERLHVSASEGFSTIYVGAIRPLNAEAPALASASAENIYRYDVARKTLSYILQADADNNGRVGISASRDGRYVYLRTAGVRGFNGVSGQLIPGFYRYDDVEKAVECVTCASSFNPEPSKVDIAAEPSANGDFVFFDTVAALVPQDVDGEVAPEPIVPGPGEFSEHPSVEYSTSSDVYEWRRNGLDGCTHIQGCLSLITSGQGGFKNVLLGSTPSGRDVFFGTHEALVAQDTDTAGDIYDARIGGGYPPPPPLPVECEGDACQSPLSAPVDATPGSLTFSGPGNAVTSTAKAKPKKKAKHKKIKRRRRRGHRTRQGRHTARKRKGGR